MPRKQTRTPRPLNAPAGTTDQHRSLGATLEFLRLLWAINHGLNKTSRQMQTQFGVTGQQRLVIRIVGAFPGLSAGDIARILHIHPSTLTGILQRLVHHELLRRSLDPDDARRARLELTAKGKRLTAPSVGTVEIAVKKVLSRFGDHEVRDTRELLTALADGLDVATSSPVRSGRRPLTHP